eukprot:1142219-Pelagomonas_calceolata.AAC.2
MVGKPVPALKCLLMPYMYLVMPDEHVQMVGMPMPTEVAGAPDSPQFGAAQAAQEGYVDDEEEIEEEV